MFMFFRFIHKQSQTIYQLFLFITDIWLMIHKQHYLLYLHIYIEYKKIRKGTLSKKNTQSGVTNYNSKQFKDNYNI